MTTRVLAMVAGLLAGSATCAGGVAYTVVDLGRAFGDYPQINAGGAVSFTSSVSNRATRWVNGVATTVNMGAGPPSAGTGAMGINAQGDISGYYDGSRPSANIGGVPVSFTSIVEFGRAVAINDNGSVGINRAGSSDEAFFYNGGSHTQLSGQRVVIEGMNNADAVVGTAVFSGSTEFRAFRWVNGVMTYVGPGAATMNSGAYDINDAGHIAGDYWISGGAGDSYQPFVRSPGGAFTFLPRFDSTDLNRGLAINEAGNLVVGFVRQNAGGFRAVKWEDGAGVWLNDEIGAAGWVLEQATDVNAAGQVVGLGQYQGQVHAFLLNPVPGPGVAGAIGLGLACVWCRRRR